MGSGGLREALKALLEGVDPGDAIRIAGRILRTACMVSLHDADECWRVYEDYRWEPERVKFVAERFEQVGWCLVEKGVEAPKACSAPIQPRGGERLLVVGKRAQALLNEEGKSVVVRKDGKCLVAIGGWDITDQVVREEPFEKRGLVDLQYSEGLYSVGECSVEDMPVLARQAEEIDVEDVVSECEEEARDRVEELTWDLVSEELESCLKLLEEYERGRGGAR